MKKYSYIDQRERLIIFALYCGAFYFLSLLITKQYMPVSGSSGLWFYAILFYLLFKLIINPFFHTPRDILVNTIGCLCLLLAFDFQPTAGRLYLISTCIWWAGLIYYSILIISSSLSILTKDFFIGISTKVNKVSNVIAKDFGSGKMEFSILIFLGLSVYQSNVIPQFFLIIFSWIILITVEPLEKLFHSLELITTKKMSINKIGQIESYENPGLALASIKYCNYRSDVPIWVLHEDGSLIACVRLAEYKVEDLNWSRLLFSGIKMSLHKVKDFRIGDLFSAGSIFSIPTEDLPEETVERLKEDNIISNKDILVGFVSEGSQLNHIKFDIMANENKLYEGCLIETEINNHKVIYQVVGGNLRRENLANKNTEGFNRGVGRKIGRWDHTKARFITTPWMPKIYSPVFLCREEVRSQDFSKIGRIPGSNFHIEYLPNLAVTHNTAILGILGIGKSFLAYELIARMIRENIKVVCLDITGQYQEQLDTLINRENAKSIERLNKILARKADYIAERKIDGGNHNDFRMALYKEFSFFLREDNPELLRLYNPEDFGVTKQEWQGRGVGDKTVPLTVVEVTQIIAESLLRVVKDLGITRDYNARSCLILEEAHSLIPEWTSVSLEGDKKASVATAKALMQGRKYGLGCMVVTQRTANVIKSILNQCNTVMAFRIFDSTGMEFLSNYIGPEYTEVLSGLQDRQVVVFGRGVSTDQPIIIEVNDRGKFLQNFDLPNLGNGLEIPEFCGEEGSENSTELEDDIPF